MENVQWEIQTTHPRASRVTSVPVVMHPLPIALCNKDKKGKISSERIICSINSAPSQLAQGFIASPDKVDLSSTKHSPTIYT